MISRSGFGKNNLSGDASYRSFTPTTLLPNPTITLNNEGVALLIEANKKLALLDGLSSRMPNMNLFISIYVRKDALMSS